MENKGELYGDEEYSYDNYEYIQPDWRAYYNATDKNFISESLFEMGYDIFTSRFIDALVDSESLILLRPEDIRSILRDVPIGIIVKFEKRFNEWKKAKLISEETQSIESSQHQINLSQSSNLTDLNTRESINTILMSSDEGIRFLSTIDKSKKMSVKQQEQFMSLICSYYLKRNIDIKLKDIDELSKIINDEFPMEPVSAYFNKETRTGPLYTKLNNMKSLLRSKHLLPPSRKRKAVVEKSRPPTLVFSKDECDANSAVQICCANMDITTLRQHWKLSSKIRLEAFRNEKDKLFSRLYPALKRPDAFSLIFIDFESLYPNANKFKTEWDKNENKLIQVLMETVNNPQMKKSLVKASTLSYNQKIAIILQGIHHALFSAGITRRNAVNFKPSINETFKFLLFITNNEGTKDIDLNNWKNENETRNLITQAIIVGFGSSAEDLIDKFCVIFEDMQFVFAGPNALITSLDLLMKIYHVFHINYPELNHNVFSFLFQKFFGIAEDSNKKNSGKIIQLMNLLD